MELRRRFRVRAIIALTAAAQLTAAIFSVLFVLTPSPAAAVQSVPYKINFQGRLTDASGNALSDGSYNIKFRLFDAATSGTNRWEADRVRGSSDYRVSVTNGLFNIQFGDTTKGDPALSPSLFNSQTYSALYLEVELPTPATATCATNGCAGFTEGAMTPRQPLASSPYAFNADALDGLDSSSFVQLSPSGGTQTGNIDISGNMLAAGAVQAATGTFSGAGGVTLGSTANAASLVLKDGTSNNRAVTLNVAPLSASYTVTLPTAAPGTSQCLQTSSGSATQLVFDSCSVGGATVALGNLSSVAINTSLLPASANAIDLGDGTKTWRTGYLATSLLTPLLDALSSSTALNIGTTNASVINLNQTTQIKPTSDTTTTFNIKTSLDNNMFTVDTQNSRVGIALGSNNVPAFTGSTRGLQVSGALRLSSSYSDTGAFDSFLTPAGSSVDTRVNIPYMDPSGTYRQVIAVGIPNCTLQGDHTTNCTAPGSGQVSDTHRGIVVFDERQGTANHRHQPSLGVFSPDEASIAGIGWDGGTGTALFQTMDHTSGGSTAGLILASGNTQGGSFGNSGDVAIQTGTIADGTGSTTGSINIKSGNATGTSASSGGLTIDSGTHTSGGTSGGITIGATNASSLTLGNSSANLLLNSTTVQRAGTALTLDLATAATSTLTITNSDASNVANLSVEGGISIGSGQTTFSRNGSGTSDYTVALTGVTVADATSSLLRLGNAITSGNATTNGGTYLGINLPGSGAGSAADFLNFQKNNTLELKVDNSGVLTAAGTLNTTGGAIQTNSTDRIDNSGNLTNIGNITGTGAVTLRSGGSSDLTLGTSGAGAINIGPSNATSIVLGGNTSATVTVKTANSSSTAFVLQTAGGTNLLVADTSAGKLTVGVADGNATLLVLDTKNTTGDPTAIDGAMYYNSALASFRCARDGAWSNCANNEIDHGYNFEDDFLSGTATSGQIGALGWALATTGTCAPVYNPTTGITLSHDHPGVLELLTTANSSVCLARMSTANTVTAAADDVLKFTVAAGEATNIRHEIGLANFATAPATNTAPTSGVWWESNPGTNARWQYCYANNGTPTCGTNTNATPTITANAWNKFEIRIVSSTAVDFIYNGTKVSLTGLTLDLGGTNKLTPGIYENGQTNANHALYVDYFQWRGVITTSGGR
jgi:hypothetical protein